MSELDLITEWTFWYTGGLLISDLWIKWQNGARGQSEQFQGLADNNPSSVSFPAWISAEHDKQSVLWTELQSNISVFVCIFSTCSQLGEALKISIGKLDRWIHEYIPIRKCRKLKLINKCKNKTKNISSNNNNNNKHNGEYIKYIKKKI